MRGRGGAFRDRACRLWRGRGGGLGRRWEEGRLGRPLVDGVWGESLRTGFASVGVSVMVHVTLVEGSMLQSLDFFSTFYNTLDNFSFRVQSTGLC